MKHIPIWKIIVFSIITFGVYDFVWYVKRQREMESTYSLKMPHWLWMLAPQILLLSIMVPLFIFMLALGEKSVPLTFAFIFIFILPPFAIATIGLTLWWFIGFSRSTAKVIAERVPIGWSLALFMLVGKMAHIVALQYYINRYAGDKLPTKIVGPSQKFKNVAILAIVISIALMIMSNNYSLSF